MEEIRNGTPQRDFLAQPEACENLSVHWRFNYLYFSSLNSGENIM